MTDEEMLDEIFEYLVEYFKDEPEKALYWIFYPNPMFGEIKPAKMILTGRTKKVWSFVRNAREENMP